MRGRPAPGNGVVAADAPGGLPMRCASWRRPFGKLRSVRALGDGFAALLLPIYLVERGFSALAVGAIVTGTLIGAARMALWVGWIANRRSRRLLLLVAAGLMAADRGRLCGPHVY